MNQVSKWTISDVFLDFFVIRQFSLPTRGDLEFDFFQSDQFVSKGVLTRSKVDVFRFSTPKTHQKAMQIQPGGQETGPTNRGHLRRTENQLIYDSFHPLRPPCGGAETLLAGLWGRTLSQFDPKIRFWPT